MDKFTARQDRTEKRMRERAAAMADDYLNGNLGDVWAWVGNNARKLLLVHAALGVHGSDIQRNFIYSARNHMDA